MIFAFEPPFVGSYRGFLICSYNYHTLMEISHEYPTHHHKMIYTYISAYMHIYTSSIIYPTRDTNEVSITAGTQTWCKIDILCFRNEWFIMIWFRTAPYPKPLRIFEKKTTFPIVLQWFTYKMNDLWWFIIWLVVSPPLKNMSQLGWLNSLQYMEIH